MRLKPKGMKSVSVVVDKEKNNFKEESDAGWIIQVIHTLIFFGGLATGIVGVFLLFSSEYAPPPLPVAYVIANVFVLIGAGIALQALLALIVVHSVEGCAPKNAAFAVQNSFVFVWGVAMIVFGIVRFWIHHPYVLPQCPCSAYHSRIDGICVPCPGFQTDVCETGDCICGSGTCSESTATCQCDYNFKRAPNGTCALCSDRTMDSSAGRCTRCRERFKPTAKGDCSLCRNGYAGIDCMVCAEGFQPQMNEDGTIFLTEEGAMVCGPVFPGCVDDQPPGGGRSGPMCEPVENCAQHGDINAKVRVTNADAALTQPLFFTFSGETCSYNHDCSSYNCRGMCSWGKGGLEGAACLEDSDCGGGRCEGRVCGLEYRLGGTDCQCSRAGYQAPRCEMCKCKLRLCNSIFFIELVVCKQTCFNTCVLYPIVLLFSGPGFNGVYSETVCGSRGSCMPKYTDVGLGWASEYDSLQCVCGNPKGVLTEFPKYTGEFCERVTDENGQIVSCAEGYFGAQCDKTCEGGQGWGGISVCSTRGACKYDEELDEAYCECDSDMKPGGIGYFAGGGCELCASEFYGSQCAPCPGLQITSDCKEDTLILSVDPLTCFGSCNTKTCDDGKEGSGICFN